MSEFTPESIPDVADVRDSLLARIQANRVPLLAGAALLVAGFLGSLAWFSLRQEKVESLHAEIHSIVDDFRGGRALFSLSPGGEPVANRDVAEGQAKKLEEMRTRAAGTPAECHVLLLLAQRYQVLGQDDRALALIEELRSKHADSPVMRIQSYDSERASLVDRIDALCRRHREFLAQHRPVEPKADRSRIALVETDLGPLRIAFYTDVAPKHAEAFARLARAGAFNGTHLYCAKKGEYVELGGGDRTRNRIPKDDRDDDPALSVAPEPTARGVKHRRRMVTSVPLLSGDQSDRFAVVLDETRPDFDAVRTPFGELADDESAATADRLGSELTYGDDAVYVGRPEANQFPNTPSHPPLVRRVSIWKGDKLDEGHSWDTSRVKTDQPEPGGTGVDEKPVDGGGEKKPDSGGK
jgi:cyclophilin family peptidyl-prolyl cis-trans isomerase